MAFVHKKDKGKKQFTKLFKCQALDEGRPVSNCSAAWSCPDLTI